MEKAQKHQSTKEDGALKDEVAHKIIGLLKTQPNISQDALGNSLGVSRRVVQKYINILKETGQIKRVGGKRYGYWEIK